MIEGLKTPIDILALQSGQWIVAFRAPKTLALFASCATPPCGASAACLSKECLAPAAMPIITSVPITPLRHRDMERPARPIYLVEVTIMRCGTMTDRSGSGTPEGPYGLTVS